MAFDAYLKIDGVTGEATRKGFEGQIELMSFSLGVSNPTTVGSATGGSGAGKATLSDFNIMRITDSASVSLFQQCALGKSYSSAAVSLNKASGDDTPLTYLKYEFTEVFVSSIQWSGSSGGTDAPMESVSFSYASLKTTYTPQDASGGPGDPVVASYDQTKAAKA